MEQNKFKNPILTVDAIIEYQGGIVLIKRGKEPFKDKWAFPGGHVEYGETLEDAVAREVLEETGLVLTSFKQFKAYSDTDRDPRGHYVTFVFTAKAEGELKGGDDAAEAQVFMHHELPELAFDHGMIWNEYQGGK